MAALDPEVRKLALGPNYAHLSTLMADGSPHSAAVWIGVEDEMLVVYKEANSIALANIRRDPRVAISMLAHDNPYRGIRVRGEVAEIRGEPDAGRWLEARSIEYTGEPYPELPAEGALLIIHPSRQSSFEAELRHVGAT